MADTNTNTAPDPKLPSKEQIRAALLDLNPSEAGDWTKEGLPRMDEVERRVGNTDVKREHLEAAWPGFTRAESAKAHQAIANAARLDAEEVAAQDAAAVEEAPKDMHGGIINPNAGPVSALVCAIAKDLNAETSPVEALCGDGNLDNILHALVALEQRVRKLEGMNGIAAPKLHGEDDAAA